MEPVAMVGENVCIQYGQDEFFRKVTWLESLPPFQFLNIGAIAAQSGTGVKTQATNLEWQEEEFAQIRWFPMDNAQFRLWLPEADGKYRMKSMLAYVDMNTIERDPCLHLTEFFVWEDNSPYFEAINPQDYALAQCRLIGMGFRYKVAKLSDTVIGSIKQGAPCTYVAASGRN
jgi:hypothetical protein